MCSFHLGSDWAAYRLYRELGWSAYRQSSADRVFGRLHRRVLVLRALAFVSAQPRLSSPVSFLVLLMHSLTRAFRSNLELIVHVRLLGHHPLDHARRLLRLDSHDQVGWGERPALWTQSAGDYPSAYHPRRARCR